VLQCCVAWPFILSSEYICGRARSCALRWQRQTGNAFVHAPLDATRRYTAWLTALQGAALYAQQFRELTLIQPTWFLRRTMLAALGGYIKGAIGSPEDMLLFYAHLQAGGRLAKVRRPLMTYTYQEGSVSADANTSRATLLSVRTVHLQAHALDACVSLSVWGVDATTRSCTTRGRRQTRQGGMLRWTCTRASAVA
jgi:hypothetical protein